MSLHVVLYNPEIPQNTGNIMRTCAATNTRLHLIEPLGFKIDVRSLRRSNLDYHEHVDYRVYRDWDQFANENRGIYLFLTRYGDKSPDSYAFADADRDYYLIFGKESHGLPKALLAANRDQCYRIPMSDKVRSLNLANTVAIVVYEALRQQGYPGLAKTEPATLKGPNWLVEK